MTDAKGTPIAPGDVIQIDPAYDNKGFGGCLAIVSEPKNFGCQCYVRIPGTDGGEAYVRINSEHFERIGHAMWE